VPGEDLANVFYDIVEMEPFAGRRVVVVGGGDSAAESALGLSNQTGTVVHLVHRGERFDRMQPSLQAKLRNAVSEGRLTPILKARVVEIRETSLALDVDVRRTEIPYDDLIIRVGGEAPTQMLEGLGVRIISKDIPLHAPEEALIS
jgi:thioredoxin reductase (NADPH)